MLFYILGAAAAAGAVIIYTSNFVFGVSRFSLKTDRVGSRVRLMLISDIHCKNAGRELEKTVLAEKPDAILIAGDLWDRHLPGNERATEMTALLNKLVPVFYTSGNHDYTFADRERRLKELADRGVRVLRADCARIKDVELCGLDMLGYSGFADGTLRAFSKKSGYRVLLTHFPHLFKDIYSKYDIDLVLSGHAHGGQFRVPFINKGVYAPGQGLWPEFSEGLHEKDGVKMIVSRGIGNSSSFPFRLFDPPEIIIIDIEPKEN